MLVRITGLRLRGWGTGRTEAAGEVAEGGPLLKVEYQVAEDAGGDNSHDDAACLGTRGVFEAGIPCLGARVDPDSRVFGHGGRWCTAFGTVILVAVAEWQSAKGAGQGRRMSRVIEGILRISHATGTLRHGDFWMQGGIRIGGRVLLGMRVWWGEELPLLVYALRDDVKLKRGKMMVLGLFTPLWSGAGSGMFWAGLGWVGLW